MSRNCADGFRAVPGQRAEDRTRRRPDHGRRRAGLLAATIGQVAEAGREKSVGGQRGAVRIGADGTAPGFRMATVTGEHRDRPASTRRRHPAGTPVLPLTPPSHGAHGVLLWSGARRPQLCDTTPTPSDRFTPPPRESPAPAQRVPRPSPRVPRSSPASPQFQRGESPVPAQRVPRPSPRVPCSSPRVPSSGLASPRSSRASPKSCLHPRAKLAGDNGGHEVQNRGLAVQNGGLAGVGWVGAGVSRRGFGLGRRWLRVGRPRGT